jgi:hypothetical protein
MTTRSPGFPLDPWLPAEHDQVTIPLGLDLLSEHYHAPVIEAQTPDTSRAGPTVTTRAMSPPALQAQS